MSETLAKKTFKGAIWSIFDVILRQGMGFIISLILARLLMPADYGTIGMMMVFITISNVFVDGGFSSALIRKIDRTEKDLSTAFMFNVGVGILAYILVFCLAPLASTFFSNQDLTILLRILALILIINSFSLVQNAILIYSMKVRQITLVAAISQISTGVLAIFMAYKGLGVWALIAQQIFSALLMTVLLSIITKWRPTLLFDMNSFKYLWGFGSKLLTANLIGVICGQLYTFIIGKSMGSRSLGLYSRSDQFAKQSDSIINNIINKALVPSLVRCQNDLERLRMNYIKCIEILSFCVFPLMFFMAFIGKPLFFVLFGAKWQEAIPLFQILCIGYAITCFSTLSLQLMQIMGRTDYTLKLELYKKPIFIIIIIISLNWGLKGIVIGNAIYCYYSTLVNLSVVKYLLKYDYLSQIKDIFKYLIIVLGVLTPLVILREYWHLSNVTQIVFYSISFALLYIGAAIILKVKALKDIKTLFYRIHK